MGSWYWIGLALGIGVGVGVAFGVLVASGRTGPAAAVTIPLAVASGLGVGLLIGDWPEAVGGGSGGLLGTVSSLPIVAGAIGRGGTRVGVSAIVTLAGLVVAVLGLVPGLGYLEAAVAPALALRLRGRSASRHAGLRILAKD